MLEVFTVVYYPLIWEYGTILSGWSSLRRIEGFLQQEEQTLASKFVLDDGSSSISDETKLEKDVTAVGPPSVDFVDATIGLKEQGFLRGLSCGCPPGRLTLLVGSVACVSSQHLCWVRVSDLNC